MADACGKGPGSRGRVGKPAKRIEELPARKASKTLLMDCATWPSQTVTSSKLDYLYMVSPDKLHDSVGIRNLNGRAVMSSTICIQTPNSTSEHTKVFTFVRQIHQIRQ